MLGCVKVRVCYRVRCVTGLRLGCVTVCYGV